MTPQIISKFKELPKTKNAWRAMWLGLGSVLAVPFVGVVMAIIRSLFDEGTSAMVGIPAGLGGAVVSLALAVLAIRAVIKAYKAGERSWLMWMGLVLALYIGSFWIIMIIGEFVFSH